MPRAKIPPRRRTRGRAAVALVACATLLAAGGAWWRIARVPVPEPPRVEDMGDMDPEVAALLRDLVRELEADRRDAARWARLGMAAEANGLVGVARHAYEAATSLDSREPRWWYRLALMRSRLGEPDAALGALQRAIDLAPGYSPLWARRGDWLLDRGDIVGAEAAYRRATAVDRDDPGGWIGLARLRLGQREDAAAAGILEGLLERAPGDRHALQLLGAAYRRLGRLDDAEFALRVGAAGEPARRDPWSAEIADYRRGYATLLKAATQEAMTGRFDTAIQLLTRLLQQKPGHVALTNRLADVLVAAGRPDEAVGLLNSMVNGGTVNAETHLTLATAYLAVGQVERAVVHGDRAVALGSAGARASEIRGMIAWRSGRRSDALRLLEEGRARDPRSVRLLVLLGMIRLEGGQALQALSDFGDALRRDPMHPEALAGLAMTQQALGASDEAALALARAEQIAPEHPRVREARQRLAARR